MDRETLDRVFDPFFTTKIDKGGTGLGLATVYAFTKESHGAVDATSEPGTGTTITMWLPEARGIHPPTPTPFAAQSAVATVPAGARVLVVEDRADVRASMSRILSHHGFVVIETSDGDGALRRLADDKAFALMCIDGVMPGLETATVIERARELAPSMPVLVCSGHVQEELLRRGIATGRYAFLSKPFSSQQLLASVTQVLGSRGDSTVDRPRPPRHERRSVARCGRNEAHARPAPVVLRCAPMDSLIPRRVRSALYISAICAVLVMAPAVPAAAQAKGSAEAAAAKRVDPHWKAPRTAWGHPDLEGIWTTDDMRGVPMSRQQQYGTRLYLTDEEFAARAKQRQNARDVDDARTGTFRNEEGSRDFSYTSMVIDPADGRVPALTPAAQARAPRWPGIVRRRTLEQGPGLLALRSLHHPRCDRLVHACRVRQRRAHHPDAERDRHQLRDGARHARDPARQPAAAQRRHSAVHG